MSQCLVRFFQNEHPFGAFVTLVATLEHLAEETSHAQTKPEMTQDRHRMTSMMMYIDQEIVQPCTAPQNDVNDALWVQSIYVIKTMQGEGGIIETEQYRFLGNKY